MSSERRRRSGERVMSTPARNLDALLDELVASTHERLQSPESSEAIERERRALEEYERELARVLGGAPRGVPVSDRRPCPFGVTFSTILNFTLAALGILYIAAEPVRVLWSLI